MGEKLASTMHKNLPKPVRDVTIDLLRGYFLFMIIIDHMGSFPSLLEPFTGGGKLLVSAAEGFFFLSGLLVGRLRGWDVRMGNFDKAKRWLLHRAAVLYVVSIILTLGFTLTAWAFHYTPKVTLGVSKFGIVETLWRTLTLQYSFGLADMLPLYTIYLLGAIVVLHQLSKGRWKLVLSVSALLWAIPLVTAGYLRPVGTYFSLFSWQILFFGGIVFGYYNYEISQWWESKKRRTRLQILSFLAVVAVFGIAYSWALRLVGGLYNSQKVLLKPLFDTIELGPGRLLLFAVCIIVAYHFIRHYEEKIVRAVGWFFLPLGQHSLFVYALHSIFVFAFIGNPVQGILPATLANILILLVIWLLTLQYQKLPSKHKYL